MDTKEKDQILEDLFKDNPGSDVPQDVEIRMRRHLVTLRERMEAPKGKKRPSRTFSWGMALRYAMPAVALTCIIFISYLVISGGTFSRAYADAVKKILKARSLTYTSIHQTGDPTTTTEFVVSYKEPNLCRQSYPDGGYTVVNSTEHKDLYVYPAGKMYIETFYYNQKDYRVTPIIDEMRSLPIWAKKVPGEREMDGHNVKGFRVTKSVAKTFWVDVETGDLVRMEIEYLNAPGTRSVYKNIQFDIEYPDSFFSLEPPSGFTGKKKTYDASPSNEQDLINVLDFLTSHNANAMFPETFNYNDSSRNVREFIRPGKRVKTDEERDRIVALFNRGYSFILLLEPGTWYYAGKGVKRGAAGTPVFWYKPDRLFWVSLFSRTYYRVIYADLTVRDVAPKDLPLLLTGHFDD